MTAGGSHAGSFGDTGMSIQSYSRKLSVAKIGQESQAARINSITLNTTNGHELLPTYDNAPELNTIDDVKMANSSKS